MATSGRKALAVADQFGGRCRCGDDRDIDRGVENEIERRLHLSGVGGEDDVHEADRIDGAVPVATAHPVGFATWWNYQVGGRRAHSDGRSVPLAMR